jgi:hypothetical protein
MKKYQKPGSTIHIDEIVTEAPMVDPKDQKATLRAWNLLRDYTHTLYRSQNYSKANEDYRVRNC